MRIRSVLIALLTAALLSAAEPVLREGSPESAGVSPVRLAAALSRVQEWVDAGVMAGAVALVARNGVIVAQRAYGWADVENQLRFEPDTICQMASVTKPVTATAVMMLAEEGKLALDDPVEKYLPAFAKQQLMAAGQSQGHRAVTIRQLLTHTSGLPRDVPSRRQPAMHREWLGRRLADIADEAAKMDLLFEPGTRFLYCNAGLATAGRVVEVVSGEPFNAFLKKRLFDRLGMKDSSFQPPAAEARRVAALYASDDGERRLVYRFDPAFRITNPAPNGGLFSTARDMAVFVQMFLNEGRYNGAQILKPETVRMMLADQTPKLPEMRGLGWALQPWRPRPLEKAAFTHSGSSGTFLWCDPRRGVVGVFFPQTSGPRVREAQQEFYRLINAAVDPAAAKLEAPPERLSEPRPKGAVAKPFFHRRGRRERRRSQMSSSASPACSAVESRSPVDAHEKLFHDR